MVLSAIADSTETATATALAVPPLAVEVAPRPHFPHASPTDSFNSLSLVSVAPRACATRPSDMKSSGLLAHAPESL
ncbi:hypothetical protein [Haladaptatus litoreus]|uniref:hypothetical protein n=1 Tax=Haladaptatus litoreus TaxID=553468 RepID=UPI00111573C0|nr:hypothetical protein [Haladaptatus litoreus]